MANIVRNEEFSRERLGNFLEDIFKGTSLRKEKLISRMERWVEQKGEVSLSALTGRMIDYALNNFDRHNQDWEKVAVRLRLSEIYKEASLNRGYNHRGYGDFYSLVTQLVDLGVYSPRLLEVYTESEIQYIGQRIIDPSKDDQFTYAGLTMLYDRYNAKDFAEGSYELPQERWAIMAMDIMSKEDPENRMELIQESYWVLSNLFSTSATPTMSNAGKSFGQLSSCFIDTVDDSLRGIYDSNTDVATLSKSGGGIGVYMGKVRAHGSDIRGIKGASAGTIPWIKQLNNTAVAVDQVGKRKGAIAVYQDIWHRDIEPFLELRLNNGDERQRAHDIFLGVCIPDLYMETLEARGEWNLFDPHQVRQFMGWSLEDFYDEEVGSGSFREKYAEAVAHPLLPRKTVPALQIFKSVLKSQLETGTPFMFYRDEVNRMNPLKHMGMIYSSNLCTEIMQNMSPTVVLEEKIDNGELVTRKQMGDFVVCNLASLNLGKVPFSELERAIRINVRMLDNVIDLNENRIEVLQAVNTNQKYRAIGLGTYGLHQLLVKQGIDWESDEAVDFNDELYELIAYYTIKASADLAIERGAFPAFRGSEWETGEYFSRRGYLKEGFDTKWNRLAEQINKTGIRNGHLMAVAPNTSTSVIAGSTASTDPIFAQEYTEEKKSFKIPVVAPDLSEANEHLYKTAYEIDQKWSVRQNLARQRHIDQAISFNMYVHNDIKAKDLMELHFMNWRGENGVRAKTSYYVRSTGN